MSAIAFALEAFQLVQIAIPKGIDLAADLATWVGVLTKSKDTGVEPTEADFAALRARRKVLLASIDEQIARDRAAGGDA